MATRTGTRLSSRPTRNTASRPGTAGAKNIELSGIYDSSGDAQTVQRAGTSVGYSGQRAYFTPSSAGTYYVGAGVSGYAGQVETHRTQETVEGEVVVTVHYTADNHRRLHPVRLRRRPRDRDRQHQGQREPRGHLPRRVLPSPQQPHRYGLDQAAHAAGSEVHAAAVRVHLHRRFQNHEHP